jgi:flagellar motor switch protein FliG
MDDLPGLSMELGAPAGLPSAPSAAPITLTRKQKAAIVIRLLIEQGEELSLSGLPEHLQVAITQEIGAMRTVDRDTLSAVVEEFASELEAIGLSFPGNIAGALSVLDGKLSPQVAKRLQKEAGVRMTGDPWERIRGLETERLKEVVERESLQVAAVIMSKLNVSKAAEVLQTLPGDVARKITYAISLTGAVTPDAVDRIGLSLSNQMDAQPVLAFEDGPVQRVGAILNSSPGATRDDVLEGLDESDATFAEQVRKAIFTFLNIPTRIDARDIPKIIREVDQSELVTALAAAMAGDGKEAAEFILANMSQRMAASLKEEVEGLGKVKEKDGEAAMSAVVAVIRDLEGRAEILLLSDEDE